MSYAELQVTSNFSFRLGGSHPEELVDQAADLGYTAIAITDRNTFAGVVRAYVVAKDRGIKFIPAVRLDLLDGPSLLAYPTDQAAYSRLSGLLTLGNLRAEKEKCFLYKADVYAYSEGSIFVIIPPQSITADFELPIKFKNEAAEYRQNIKSLYLAASRTFTDGDAKRLFLLSELGILMVATNDVHYHDPGRRELQDVLTCVRHKRTIFNAGYLLHQNAERYLKEGTEMARLFQAYPEAIANTQKIADACNFDLKSLQYEYPDELVPEGMTADEYLADVTFKGAHEFFGEKLAPKLEKQLRFELDFVKRRGHAKYFLTVHDYVAWARAQKILCQGRGSAANSAMCYCLGITPVNPMKYRLLFSRFMSDDRPEPPDIDVDFEHERREEVMQYVFNRFGRDRAAILPTVTVLQSKGAIQDVGRAMGLQVDTVKKLSKAFEELADDHIDEETIIKLGLNPKERHLRKVIQLTSQLIGFPRQLGQHTGGFVITQGKLSGQRAVNFYKTDHCNRRRLELLLRAIDIRQYCAQVTENICVFIPERPKQEAELASLREKFGPLTLDAPHVREIQQFLDIYNDLLDHDFRLIKRARYSNFWKIGLGIMRYSQEECSFIVYPIPYGTNETLIRQVKPGSIKDIGREFVLGTMLRAQSYNNRNPISESAETLAYELIESDFKYLIDRVQFEVPDDFMANEYIHGFTSRFATFLDLDRAAESYDLDDLHFLVNDVLPQLLNIRLNIPEGPKRFTHNIDSYQKLKPHANHRQSLMEARKRATEGHITKFNIEPVSSAFDVDILKFYIDHLRAQGIRQTRRVYDPNSRIQSTGGFIWESWNNKVLISNVSIVIHNLKRVYQLLIERYFPGLAKDLELFRDGNLLLYCLSFEHGRHAGPQLEYYKLWSHAKLPAEVRFCTSADRPFTRESLMDNEGWTMSIGKKVYDLHISGGEKVAFIFEPLPMHTFVKHLVRQGVNAMLSKKAKGNK